MEEKKYQIATHNGVFHADEVMAIAVIREVMPDIPVVRTRDPEIIAKSLIAVDVGGEYSEGSMRFDHHQREGAGGRWDTEVRYSSCGLIWGRFGGEICSKYFEFIGDQRTMFSAIDGGIISSIDLIDCEGIKALGLPNTVPHFQLSQVIAGFNGSSLSEDAAFADAVAVAEKILRNELRRCAQMTSSQRRLECDMASSEVPILVLKEFVPGWAQNNTVKDAGFARVVFRDIGGTWRCQTVPETSLLPEEWGGLNGEALVAECGVKGAIFCHRGLFIAGADSFVGAMELATRSLPVI